MLGDSVKIYQKVNIFKKKKQVKSTFYILSLQFTANIKI